MLMMVMRKDTFTFSFIAKERPGIVRITSCLCIHMYIHNHIHIHILFIHEMSARKSLAYLHSLLRERVQQERRALHRLAHFVENLERVAPQHRLGVVHARTKSHLRRRRRRRRPGPARVARLVVRFTLSVFREKVERSLRPQRWHGSARLSTRATENGHGTTSL